MFIGATHLLIFLVPCDSRRLSSIWEIPSKINIDTDPVWSAAAYPMGGAARTGTAEAQLHARPSDLHGGQRWRRRHAGRGMGDKPKDRQTPLAATDNIRQQQ